jgi:hypothetical protein
MPYDLDPTQQYSYDSQKRSAMRNYSSSLNRINLQTSQLDSRYGRDFGSQTRNWNKARASFPRGFNQRGLMTSGIYNREMQDFDAERQDSFGRLAEDYYNQRANYANQSDESRGGYEDMMANIEDQQRMYWAQKAAQIRGTA